MPIVLAFIPNDVNGGQLDDPESNETPQLNWLVDTLKAIRKEDDGRAVFLAIHYPPFSGASNFPQRGNPNLGPTPHTRVLKPLAENPARGVRGEQALSGRGFLRPRASLSADDLFLRRWAGDPLSTHRWQRGPRAR